jgi:hypothetical protein
MHYKISLKMQHKLSKPHAPEFLKNYATSFLHVYGFSLKIQFIQIKCSNKYHSLVNPDQFVKTGHQSLFPKQVGVGSLQA